MEIKPKVIIGMPAQDFVEALTLSSIANTIIASKECEVIDFVLRQSCEIASARTYLVNEALKRGGDYLLFVDSDIAFPEDALDKLISHKKDIVCGRYHMRKFPLEWVHKPVEGGEESETELFEAKYAGTGFMLIDLSIFKEEWQKDGKKQPWFAFGRDSQGALALGEDAWFCFSARDMGFSTWIDPTIKVAHLGTYMY